MSLTKKEVQEFNDLLLNWLDDFDASDFKEIVQYLEQKKKQWMELAVAEYKLKKEMETKFYTSGSGDNWKWKCVKCGAEGGLYDAHYSAVGGYVCNNCLTDRP
jgi:hypothetical protein